MQNQKLNDYYDLALICEDDILSVAFLVEVSNIIITTRVVNNLENHRLKDIDFDTILQLKVSTIRDLVNIFKVKMIDYENNKNVKMINKSTDLLDMMEVIE